jgi:hypothetical protein
MLATNKNKSTCIQNVISFTSFIINSYFSALFALLKFHHNMECVVKTKFFEQTYLNAILKNKLQNTFTYIVKGDCRNFFWDAF